MEDNEGADNCVLLVRRNVQPGHPHAIWNRLFAEARILLREGIKESVIREALQEWDRRPGLSPSILPNLVSDVIRAKNTHPEDEARREYLADWESRLDKEMNA